MFAVGNNPNRAHNYFQDFWKRFSILIKAQQLQLNRKNRNKSKKRERGKPPGPHLCWPSPPGSAQPTGLASRPPPPARRTRSAWSAPAATRRPPPASADAWRRLGVPRDPHVPFSSSLTLPSSPSPSPAPWSTPLSPSHRRSRALRHPLASLTCPEAPPRRPRPPHRATLRRRPCITAIGPSSTSVPARRRSSIRLAPVAPEPTELLIDLPVSFAAFPLFFPTHLHPLGHSSTMAEARLRSSSSPASLRRPFGPPVLCNVLAASRSASLALQFPCLHAASHFPHMAELRPPPWSSPRRLRPP